MEKHKNIIIKYLIVIFIAAIVGGIVGGITGIVIVAVVSVVILATALAEIRKSGFSAITAHQRMGEGKRTLKTSSIILNRGIQITMP